jgi:hypothetical protein
MMIHFSKKSFIQLIRFALIIGTQILLATGLSATAQGQKRSGQSSDDEAPVFREYRGVQIGMTVEEARKKLGDPKDKSDDQDFFVINDKEAAQIVYDKSHRVATLSVDYMSGATGVPLPKAVVGSDIQAKPDGSMYLMVRYPKAGCWVSYSKTAGDTPMISVTIQKIN